MSAGEMEYWSNGKPKAGILVLPNTPTLQYCTTPESRGDKLRVVPALLVTHYLIFMLLLRREGNTD